MSFFRKRNWQAGLSTGRVESLSDSVFAIAMTILVIEISIPEVSRVALVAGDLHGFLSGLLPRFVSYGISFAVIGIFWMGHHLMFHFVKRTDRTFLWLNMLFLMVITFIPFPAALIGQYAHKGVAVIVYGATLEAASILFMILWWYASRRRRLISSSMSDRLIMLAWKAVVVAPIVYGLAIFAAHLNPEWGIYLYILVPLIYIFPSPIDELVHFASGDNSYESTK